MVQERYVVASKKEKRKILDEFAKVTGHHGKPAIRLFHRRNQRRIDEGHGRPGAYGTDLARGLRTVWEASDRLCSKRLHPFLPERLAVLKRHRHSSIPRETEAKL